VAAALRLDLPLAHCASASVGAFVQLATALATAYALALAAAYVAVPPERPPRATRKGWADPAGTARSLSARGNREYAGAAAAPRSRLGPWLASWAPLAPLSLCYLCLLVLSYQPDTLSLLFPYSREGLASGVPQFFPTVGSISRLFSRDVTAASLWVHLLSVNAAACRWTWLQAGAGALSRAAGALGVLGCAVFAPAGVLVTFAASTFERNQFFWRPPGDWEQAL